MKEARHTVQFKRRISKRIRRTSEGINLATDVNADVSVNVSRAGVRPALRRPPAATHDQESEERRPDE
jgi:hypothetical protein